MCRGAEGVKLRLPDSQQIQHLAANLFEPNTDWQ